MTEHTIPFSYWLLIAPFLSSLLLGLLLLGAVALGALICYKTKREAHERLFSMRPPKGEAFVVDPYLDGPSEGRPASFSMDRGEGWGSPGQPKEPDAAAALMEEQTTKFLEQMAMAKAVAQAEDKVKA